MNAPLNPGIVESRLREKARAESTKPPVVRDAPVFDKDSPADSYSSGTEINFGETAPIDMSGIPDLFDPEAVTGDGI